MRCLTLSRQSGNFHERSMKSAPMTIFRVLLLTVIVAVFDAPAQNLLDRKTQNVQVRQECAEIFRAVERGLVEGTVSVFSKYLGSQVYLNLPGDDGGYYSANQGYYVLQNYLGGRTPQSFRFTTYGELENTPYATGPGRFVTRAGVETVQVYVALSKPDNQWVVSQINIY